MSELPVQMADGLCTLAACTWIAGRKSPPGDGNDRFCFRGRRFSASIASMSNPISLANASSSHHSSGGFGIEVSPEPWINAHPVNGRNAAEHTEPPERTITVRPCGGET
jgi:hypothetical protein